jgi:hypothetical protein
MPLVPSFGRVYLITSMILLWCLPRGYTVAHHRNAISLIHSGLSSVVLGFVIFVFILLGQTERTVVSTEGFALLPAFASRPF